MASNLPGWARPARPHAETAGPARSRGVTLLQRYALAVGISLAAGVLQWLVRPWIGARVPFLLFLPAVALVAARAGSGPGLLVAVLGLVNGALWLPPLGLPLVTDTQGQLATAIYAVFSAALVAFGARLHASNARVVATEERLALAGEDSSVNLFDIDLLGGTAYLSPGLRGLLGVPGSSESITFDELIAHLPRRVIDDGRGVLLSHLGAGADAFEVEQRWVLPDGGARWLLLRVHVARERELAVRLRGACIDITERKVVAAQLEQTRAELTQQIADLQSLHGLSSRLLETRTLKEQLQMILFALADFHGTGRGLVSILDPETGVLQVQAQLGFSEAALAELVAVRKADAPQLAADLSQRVVVEDMQNDTQFGALRQMALAAGIRAVHSTPLFGLRGDVLGAISVHFDACRSPTARERALADICARKAAVFVERAQAEAAVAETKGRFEAVLEASAVPFAMLAPLRAGAGADAVSAFGWNYLNSAAARTLGKPAVELLGQPMADALAGAVDGSSLFAECSAVLADGQVREFDLCAGRDGTESWFHCIASPMHGLVALWFADITERKQSEQLLREADRRKDEFLATLAHELRNPLAPIRQAALLSSSPQAQEEQKRWSRDVIDRQVQHMALLLDDLLDVSRITRGALTLRKTSVTLDHVVAEAIETVQPVIDGKRQQLQVELPAGVNLEADPLRLAQVLANLLGNAAKFTADGGHIGLRAWLEGADVVIEVRDEGIGIAAESLPEMFRMFTQLRSAANNRGGLGIGLALSKGFVELHGGRIAARSDGPGRGSTFTVRLPIGSTALPAAPEAASALRKTVQHRILIADDNRDAAQSLAALLELQGHEAALAYDGDEALAVFDRFRPDVCLLDIGMPRRSGNEVARALRQMPGGDRALLVAITGWGQEHDVRNALNAGFDRHLTKPVDPDELSQIVVAERN